MTTEKRRPRAARRRALGALAATAAIALAGGGVYAASAPSNASGAEGDLQAQALPSVAFKAPRIIIRGDIATNGQPVPGGTPGHVVPGFGVFDGQGIGTVPTSLALSPVKKQLFVATQFGKIFVFNLDAGHNATLVNTITSIEQTPNQLFNGVTPKAKVARQTTGIVFAPAAKQPKNGNVVLYVSHSDPDIFDDAEPGHSKVNPSSGMLSRLLIDGNGNVLNRKDMVVGLPRSGENHSPNGMSFGPDGWLYLGLAGNTNGGGQSKQFAWFPEVPLGSSVVRINVDALEAQPAPIDTSVGSRFTFTDTCGGSTVPNNCTAAYTLAGSAANNGTKPGLLEIYAMGYRNPYDMVWHTNGKLYLNENEGNPGFGPKPGPSVNNPSAPCPGPASELTPSPDQLFLVQPGGYHGHPNPSRNQCQWGGGVQAIGNYFFASSSTGIAEFTPFVFGPALQGDLLTTNYGNTPKPGVGDTISRVKLSPDGNSVVEIDNQFLTGFNDPLDIVVDADGTLIVAEHGYKNGNFGKISVLEPLGNFVCPAPGDPAAVDSDGDGFKDAAEIAAGTNHCNPSSAPSDADGDKLPDASDPDDDNDGIPDAQDRFQLDNTNGAGTALPFVQDFAGSAGGGFSGSGLKGYMNSSKGGGVDQQRASAGGAGGYLQILANGGTAEGAANNQLNALQQGFKPAAPATVSAALAQPFGTQPQPQGNELAGIHLGPGENDFVRLSVHANGGTPVIELGLEQGGAFQRLATAPVTLPQSSIRLFLDLDPGTDAVKARYQVGTGPVTDLGAPFAVPPSWLDTVAAGLMTSTAGSPKGDFGFIYDDFRIEAGPAIAKPPTGPGGGTSGVRQIKVINGQVCRAVPARPRLRVGTIKLRASQMLKTQQVSQTALRRLAAVEARLKGKLSAADLCGGAITANLLAEGIQTATGATNELVASNPALITTKAVKASRKKVRLSARQLLINQRIAQAAVLRASAIEARLNAGLTGGDLKAGAIGAGQLAQGLRIVSARQVGNPPAATRTRVGRGSTGSGANVRVSRKQLEINHKIALAALRRANALVDRLETGLLKGDFKARSISAVSLDPSLRS